MVFAVKGQRRNQRHPLHDQRVRNAVYVFNPSSVIDHIGQPLLGGPDDIPVRGNRIGSVDIDHLPLAVHVVHHLVTGRNKEDFSPLLTVVAHIIQKDALVTYQRRYVVPADSYDLRFVGHGR